MVEYEVYLPLHYNDGRPVEGPKLDRLKRRLVDAFGGLTDFPQENQGVWKFGPITYRDRIVILRVLAGESQQHGEFFRELKAELKRDWGQTDVLIVAREVTAL